MHDIAHGYIFESLLNNDEMLSKPINVILF